MYGTVVGWIEYAALRGLTVANDAASLEALQRASDYIRTRYVLRLGLEADDPNVIEATYIAAGYDLASPGFWTKTFIPSSSKVLTEVKGIRWTLTGGGKGMDSMLPTSPAIDALFIDDRVYGLGVFVV